MADFGFGVAHLGTWRFRPKNRFGPRVEPWRFGGFGRFRWCIRRVLRQSTPLLFPLLAVLVACCLLCVSGSVCASGERRRLQEPRELRAECGGSDGARRELRTKRGGSDGGVLCVNRSVFAIDKY